MKTIITSKFVNVLLVSVFSLVIITLFAACAGEDVHYTQVNVEGVLYQLDDTKYEATAIGVAPSGTDPSWALVIQNSVQANGNKYSVTAIAPRAFLDSDFTMIVLGENLRNIGNDAFKYCKNIQEICFFGQVLPPLNEGVFDDEVYESATMIIEKGTQLHSCWLKFEKIKYSFTFYL